MVLILSIATIASVGLMIGVELAVWVFINPILWKLDDEARRQAVRLSAKKLGTAMPFWYGANFVLLVVELFLTRGQSAMRLLGTASAIWAAVIVLTLILLVPINNRLVREDTKLSLDQAHRQHQRWDMMHRIRVVALSVAFVMVLIALHP